MKHWIPYDTTSVFERSCWRAHLQLSSALVQIFVYDYYCCWLVSRVLQERATMNETEVAVFVQSLRTGFSGVEVREA